MDNKLRFLVILFPLKIKNIHMKKSSINAVGVIALFIFIFSFQPIQDYSLIYQDLDESKTHLKEDSTIQGFPCTAWVHFYPDGKLKQFELAHDYVIAGVIFPKNTIVFLDDNGKLNQVYLSKDTDIHSYPCPGGNMKEATGFYPSGKLRFFFPREDMLVNGYPVKGGSMKGVWFYESGKLKKFYLTREYTINGRKYNKGDEVNI